METSCVFENATLRLRSEALDAFKARLDDVKKALSLLEPQVADLQKEQELLKFSIHALENV